MAESNHPFSYPEYRLFWCARLSAMLAHSATVISLGWLVYDVARQTMDVREAALRLGLIGLAQFLPVLLLSPVTGIVADRFDRRMVVRISLLLQACLTAIIVWLVYQGQASLEILFVLASILAGIRAFFMPAMSALVSELVPAAVLPKAIALNSVAGEIGGITGPAVGGFALGYSQWGAFACGCMLIMVALLCMLFIGRSKRKVIRSDIRPMAMMIDGFRYVRTNRLLLGAISLDLFSVLLGGVTAMLPVFARDILFVGPEGLGLMRSAPSIGAVATAVALSIYPLRNNVGAKMLGAVSIFGFAVIGFGLSTLLPVSLICLTILGAADMISVYVRQTLVQVTTPDAMRGRVGAVSLLFISGSNELGELESGLLAAALGPVAAVVAGGICAVVVAGLWTKLFPELLQAKTFDLNTD